MRPFTVEEVLRWLQEDTDAILHSVQIRDVEERATLRFTANVELIFLTRDRMRHRLMAIINRYGLQAAADLKRLLQRINPHLPGPGELRADLRFAFTRSRVVRYERARVRGLEQPDRIFFLFQPGPKISFACMKRVWDPGMQTMIYHLGARLPDDTLGLMADPDIALHFIVDHPNLFLRARLPDELRLKLHADLTDGAPETGTPPS